MYGPPLDPAPLDVLWHLLAEGGVAELHEDVDRLERRIAALPERAMRRSVLVDVMTAWPDARLVAALDLLSRRASAGRGRSRAVMEEVALLPSIFDDLPYARTQGAYHLARQARLDRVARLFLGAARAPAELEDLADNLHFDAPAGVRREAARSRDRFTLDRLMHDRDPRVIGELLSNPRIIERDVVRIAAMRPTRPEVLALVAAHARWSSSYRVRTALACNPCTPTPIARRLLPTLMRQHLRHVVEAGVLPPELQTEATDLLRARAREAGEGDRETQAAAAEVILQLVVAPVDE